MIIGFQLERERKFRVATLMLTKFPGTLILIFFPEGENIFQIAYGESVAKFELRINRIIMESGRRIDSLSGKYLLS